MNIEDKVCEFYRRREWKALHDFLDTASPGRDPDERNRIGHWRAFALSAEGRHQEAIEVLRSHRADCGCQTWVNIGIAENLRRLGRDIEAITELMSAPMAEEAELYRALVTDAKYLLAHLLASNGLPVDKALLDDIPDGYIHITDRGQRISKSDLMKLISP